MKLLNGNDIELSRNSSEAEIAEAYNRGAQPQLIAEVTERSEEVVTRIIEDARKAGTFVVEEADAAVEAVAEDVKPADKAK